LIQKKSHDKLVPMGFFLSLERSGFVEQGH